jgi:parallel beta-helix repeat protein
MYKKTIPFIIISMSLLLVILESCTLVKVFATPEIRHVPTQQYPTIQAAINDANSGDTIQVAKGFYNENVVVNQSVTLIGESPSNTIIDGSGKEKNTVHVIADNVRIEGFTIQNGEGYEPASLSIWQSKGHTIRNNIIEQSYHGLVIRDTNDSNIVNNVITNTTIGIFFSSCNGNNVTGNLIEENINGAWITFTQGFITVTPNKFYHNNFIDNTNQPSAIASTKWDNGAEGNYWSDYSGQDLNGDGIGDTNIPHHGLDWYPLTDKWSETKDFPTIWNGATYHTVISKNSTIASFNFTYPLAQISFNVTGPAGTVSFCNVTIEKSFLDGTFTVLVDGIPKNYDLRQNVTHASLYFTISHSVRKIRIRGTEVIGNTIPTADFTYSPAAPKESQEIQFTDASTDPNGTVAAWSWSFGDGNTSSLQNPVHRYMIKGSYNVTLTVADNENVTNTITKTIVVASFALDYTFYYVLIGILAGAVILVIALFLFRQKKKHR